MDALIALGIIVFVITAFCGITYLMICKDEESDGMTK